MSENHIFISWSLPASQKTAGKVYAFFQKLFPTFGFFISSENISSGQRWYDVISERLDGCNIGIVVVTEENYLRPWIHYESGALAKVVTKARVMPLLCGVSNRVVADTPLSAFQASELSKHGIRRIADSIREMTGYAQNESDFVEHFESLWGRYGEALCEIEPGEEGLPPPQRKAAKNPENETSARLDQLTEIVRSIEARLPTRPLTEADVHKIIVNTIAHTPPPARSAAMMSDEDIMAALGIDTHPQSGRLMTQRNALAHEDLPIRRGLLAQTENALSPRGNK